MNNRIPEIRWKNPWLLREAIYDDVIEAYKGEEDKLTDEFALATIKRYYDAWTPYEKRILEAMCDATGLEFRQNIIDIYVAPFRWSFSDPMVITTKYGSNRAIEVITHEILHRLLTDNTRNDYRADFVKKWRELFGNEHTKNTLVHIPVHALMQAIFEEYIGEPERIIRDKEMYKGYPDYEAAWDYVEKVGYKKIIEQLRSAKYEQPTEEQAI